MTDPTRRALNAGVSGGIRYARPSRRGVIRGGVFALAGAGAAALVGCGGDDDAPDAPGAPGPATPGDEGEPTTGGAMRVAMIPANQLDPAFSLTSSENIITMATHDNLILQMHDQSLRPMLAESWEESEDVSQYVFNLRRGVQFSHGKELRAEDVVATFERLTDPDVGSPARSSLASIESINELDEYTVRMDLRSPNVFLPETLSLYQGRVTPADVDPDRFANETFGTGPFRLTEHRPGERTSFERNPEYWDEGKPYLDTLRFDYMPEPVARVEALRAASVDAIWPLEPAQARSIEGIAGAVVSEVPSTGYINTAMQIDSPPFDDVRVRRAIQLVQDREFIIDHALFGWGEVANDHPVHPEDPHWWDEQEQVRQNIEEARALLEQAGYPNGIDLTLHTSSVTFGIVELAIGLRELAEPAGIRINIERHPEDTYYSTAWLQEPFTCVGWNQRNVDEALTVVYHSDADWNEAHYYSQEMDDLIERARGLADDEERKEAYSRIQEMLIEDVPRPIPAFKSTFGAHRDTVRGTHAHPNNWLLLHESWLDQ